MSLTFLTPLGLLLALGALPPLAALAASVRRARAVRRALGLRQPGIAAHAPAALALAAVPCLLAIAVAQPVLRVSETHRVRADAEAFYVFDVSRSMQAASAPAADTRLERAVGAAKRLHASLRDVRSGVATLTDRVLPNLFPTADEEVFTATVERAVAVNSPPPRGYERVGTLFAALDTLPGTNFFGEDVRHRLVFVLTDGETAPYDTAALRDALEQGRPTRFVVVRFWHADERVWQGEQPERGYRADPRSADMVRQLASVTKARAFEETELRDAATAARRLISTGPLREEGTALRVRAFSRWFVLAAFVPLAMLLWRRNLV
jgi:hypothetical protein